MQAFYPLSDSTSLSLLQATLDGEKGAAERVYLVYFPLVHAWCSSFGLQASDVDDAAQVTLLRAFERIGQFDSARGKFRYWLWRIASNIAKDIRRQMDKATPMDPEILKSFSQPPPSATSSKLPRLVAAQAMHLIKERFPEEKYQVAHAALIQGRDAANIAEEFGITQGNVYLIKCRALNMLRKALEGFEFDS